MKVFSSFFIVSILEIKTIFNPFRAMKKLISHFLLIIPIMAFTQVEIILEVNQPPKFDFEGSRQDNIISTDNPVTTENPEEVNPPATPIDSENNADLILFNGKIITVDASDNIFQAIALKSGKIIMLGNNDEIKPLAGINCRMVNLQGKTATPGLVDSHYHIMYYRQQFWPGYLNIRHPDVKSKSDLLKVVGDRAKQLNKDEWISGNQGFHLAMNETLDRWNLDGVSPDNPVYLRHGSGQFAVANSRALEIAGIDKNTPNPPSSLILHDSLGEPTGVLSHYPAENLVAKFATGYGTPTIEEKIEDVERGQNLCLEAGYTSIQDVIVGSAGDIDIYKSLADSGRLKVRLSAMLYLNTEEQVNYYASNY